MSTPETPQSHSLTRRQRQEQAALDALRVLILDTLRDKFPQLADHPEDIPLTLSLNLSTEDPGSLSFEPNLSAQLIEQTQTHFAAGDAFAFGRIYDFYDQSHQSKDCLPPDALSVFAGYDTMGHPQWSAIQDALTDANTPYKIVSGKDLKISQLQAYGKNDKHFNILAQIVIGPLALPPAYQTLTNTTDWALTCQIVETRNARAQFELKLNLLVGALLPDEVLSLLQEASQRSLGTALFALEDAIVQLENQARNAWTHQDNKSFNQTLKKVPALLAHFAGQIN